MLPNMNCERKSSLGFTIVELVISVFLLVISFGIARRLLVFTKERISCWKEKNQLLEIAQSTHPYFMVMGIRHQRIQIESERGIMCHLTRGFKFQTQHCRFPDGHKIPQRACGNPGISGGEYSGDA